MTPAARYYSQYEADEKLSDLSWKLLWHVEWFNPVHAMDFGAGNGKHCKVLHDKGIVTLALDISKVNVAKAIFGLDLPFVALGSDAHLRHLANFDVVFTCSVLDHIEDVERIIQEFQRIANKAVVLAEPLKHDPDMMYWAHDYESMGFTTYETGYIGDDGNEYFIFVWQKEQLDMDFQPMKND